MVAVPRCSIVRRPARTMVSIKWADPPWTSRKVLVLVTEKGGALPNSSAARIKPSSRNGTSLSPPESSLRSISSARPGTYCDRKEMVRSSTGVNGWLPYSCFAAPLTIWRTRSALNPNSRPAPCSVVPPSPSSPQYRATIRALASPPNTANNSDSSGRPAARCPQPNRRPTHDSGLGVAAEHGQQLGFQWEAGRAITRRPRPVSANRPRHTHHKLPPQSRRLKWKFVMLISLRACERTSELARAPIFVLWIRLTSRYLQQLRVPCSRRGIRSTTPALAGSSCGGFLSKIGRAHV